MTTAAIPEHQQQDHENEYPVEGLNTYYRNARRGNVPLIAESLKSYGQYKPLTVNRGTYTGRPNEVLAGNHTLMAAQDIGMERLKVFWVDVDEEVAAKIVLIDNAASDKAVYDDSALLELLQSLPDVSVTGFTDQDLLDLLKEQGKLNVVDVADYGPMTGSGALSAEFLVPPFSILSASAGTWQARKKEWLNNRGCGGHATRNEAVIGGGNGMSQVSAIFNQMSNQSKSGMAQMGAAAGGKNIDGVSIFDPVLAELIVRWYSTPGDSVLDPFAGGPCRGIVAGYLGREYHGIDLRGEQVTEDVDVALEQQGGIKANKGMLPKYYLGDATLQDKISGLPEKFDFAYTCPPYFDLEQYSEDPLDLSNMSYGDFLKAHAEAIRQTVERLHNDRFMVWVVGEVRDSKTRGMRGFVPSTIQAFMDAGLKYHTDAILATTVSSLVLRAGRQMRVSRTLGRRHQHVIVGVKGSAKKATERMMDLKELDTALDLVAAEVTEE